MGTTSLAKVTCGCDGAGFTAAFDGACALAIGAIASSKASVTKAAKANERETTESDFRKDVIALPPRPGSQLSGRADWLDGTLSGSNTELSSPLNFICVKQVYPGLGAW